MRRRQAVRAAWWALALLAAAAAWDGWQWHRAHQLNLLIRSGDVVGASTGGTGGLGGAPVGLKGKAELQFAQAVALAASGATDSAVNRYGTLVADSPLGRAARYNAANLLLRQAIDLHNKQQAGQALALVELAKEGFREVLRLEPQHWAARYNLERAQRLVPDPEADADFPNEAPAAAERSATTMRGYTPGLP